MKDSDKKKFVKFKVNLERLKTEQAVVDEDYVLVQKKVWDNSQRQYEYFKRMQEAIYGKVN